MGTELEPTVQAAPQPGPAGFLSAAERKEIKGLIIGAAVVGAVSGYAWGGFFDTKGPAAAVADCLLFTGWAVTECLGLMLAKWLGLAGGRTMLVGMAAFFGGMYVAVVYVLDTFLSPPPDVPLLPAMVASVILGLVVGGIVSVICTIRLSRLAVEGDAAAGPPGEQDARP